MVKSDYYLQDIYKICAHFLLIILVLVEPF